MVKPQDAASEFSRTLASHLRDVMHEGHVTQMMIAREMGRSQAFVSERTGGVRPIDTDVLDAVARLLGWSSGRLWAELGQRITRNQ